MKKSIRKKGKRWLALALCLCLVFSCTEKFVSAAEEPAYEEGLCEHHTEHTGECGYAEATPGSPCNHEHDDSCGYAEATSGHPCTFVCAECGKEAGPEESASEESPVKKGPVKGTAAQAAPNPKQGKGTEYSLENGFDLKGTLTIDGEEPDKDTIIQDGTTFNIRLDWSLPAGNSYIAEDTFTYTLPDTIPETMLMCHKVTHKN